MRFAAPSAGFGLTARALADFANDLRVKAGAGEAQILIPIDQAEELFGVADPDEARRFLEILSQALSESLPFMAVMAVRSAFLGRLQSAAALTARFEEFSLGPMPLTRIPQIIQGPAVVPVTARVEGGQTRGWNFGSGRKLCRCGATVGLQDS